MGSIEGKSKGIRGIRVPKMKPFNGVCSAKKLKNFSWDIEQYFEATYLLDIKNATTTTMNISGDAKLW